MANFNVAKPVILALEGGLSNNPDDNASKYPAPNGYHTNKGVTWQTFQSVANSLGYPNTLDVFMKMPDEIVFAIAKKYYWDVAKLDLVNSNKKAYLVFDFAFNSGPATAIKQTQSALKIKVDGIAGAEFIGAINKANEEEFVNLLTAKRVSFIESSGLISEALKPGLIARIKKIAKKNFQ